MQSVSFSARRKLLESEVFGPFSLARFAYLETDAQHH